MAALTAYMEESLTGLSTEERAAFEALVARYPVLGRGLADSRDRVGWTKARSNRIGASDAAKFAKIESVPLYIRAKLYDPFTGNAFTQHGNDREPHMLAAFRIRQNVTLYHSPANERHVATPDGLVLGKRQLVLAQCKTTVKPLHPIPATYRRQMWWEQYVCGADRTLFIWEEHDGDGHPLAMEPESSWLDRDEAEIQKLVTIADLVLAGLDAHEQFTLEMEHA